MYNQIIDANINRVAEGLRVIEDYARFIYRHKKLTNELALLRKQINSTEKDFVPHLLIRNTEHDMRAREVPIVRKNIQQLLKANFKRVEEGLRVLEEYTGNSFYNRARYRVYDLEKDILLSAMRKTLKPGVYLISDDVKILEKGLLWGVSCIQLRDKKSPKEIVLKKAITIGKKAKAAGIPFIVNDYLDIAILSDADGFHSGQDDMGVQFLRKILGPHKIIGKSTHNLKEGKKAEKEGADYVGIGPIWSTLTKPEEKAIGLNYLRKAENSFSIPYIAIGGVNLSTMPELLFLKPPLVAIVSAYKEIPAIIKKYKKTMWKR